MRPFYQKPVFLLLVALAVIAGTTLLVHAALIDRPIQIGIIVATIVLQAGLYKALS